MTYIILTKNLIEGQKLQENIVGFNSVLRDIRCYNKENIAESPHKFKDVQFVFSTWYMPEFSEEEIRMWLPSLKAVFYAAGTVKYFAEPFLRCGIRVFSAAKANGVPVAEFVAAQIILANKGYFLAQRSYKSLLWKFNFKRSRRFAETHCGNYLAKVGLIGFGAVGQQVAKLLRPYRLIICAFDPYVEDIILEELGVKRIELSELFRECDVISNHLPDIPVTKGMLNHELFSLMKDNVTFINTGRGAQVVERDLSNALRHRKNACAVLDVTRHEPIFPWSSLMWNRKVFITPHIAGSLSGEEKRLAEEMVYAYKDFLDGRKSEYEVVLSQLLNKA